MKGREVARKFKLVFPNDTAFSPWPTEMRVCFDDQNIYVAARCRENQEDYTVQSLRRDFGGGTTDVINVLFDPSKDGLNGFMFSVSPLNVQREGPLPMARILPLNGIINGIWRWTISGILECGNGHSIQDPALQRQPRRKFLGPPVHPHQSKGF